MAVLPVGQRALSASRVVKLWDLDTGKEIWALGGHEDKVLAAVLPDNNRAVSGCADCTLRLWSLKSGELIRTLPGHDHRVTAVAVLPDGHRAVSASLDRTLKLWDLEDGQQIRTFLGPTDPKKPCQLTGGAVTALAVLPNSRHALFASDTTLRLLI
jgi:WD40 repeat protein